MRIVSRAPQSGVLFDLVDQLWMTDGAPDGVRRERKLPTGRAQMIFRCGDRTVEGFVVGPQSVASDIEHHPQSKVAGIAFKAGGLAAFAAVPVDELCDEIAPLDELWPHLRLEETTRDFEGRTVLDRLESALLERLQFERIDRRVLTAERAIRGGMSPGTIARTHGLDRRDLVPAFRRTVGVGLKHYERIHRFGRSVVALRQPAPAPVAAIAAALGYADQAHLTREFRHFAGLTPGQLHGDHTMAVNHVALDKMFKT